MYDLPLRQKITFKRKWFNPLYFIINELKDDPSIRVILVYGGKSSAKTHTVCQFIAKESAVYGHSAVIYRKESTSIKTTLKGTLKKAIKSARLDNGFTPMELEFRSSVNDSTLILKGLDEEEKVKGLEGFQYAFTDELNQLLFEEWEQLNMSLRGVPNQKIFACWNPVSKYSWVKTKLIDSMEWVYLETKTKLPNPNSTIQISADGSTVLIKTNYEDNYWIVGSPCGTYGFKDVNLINYYAKQKITNYDSWLVNVSGEWGDPQTGGEFWKQFIVSKHVKRVELHPTMPLHISIDDNVNPYITMTVWQFIGKNINQLSEILAAEPNNTAPKAARLFIAWLNKLPNRYKIFIYGDATAQKRSTVDEMGRSFFQIFMAELSKAGVIYESRVTNHNESVALTGAFVNAIYEENLFGWDITIDERCEKSIADYTSVKEDVDGTMLKEKEKTKAGVVQEKNGHISDTKRYLIVQALQHDWQRFKNGANKGYGWLAGFK